jgi:hypothetical protein
MDIAIAGDQGALIASLPPPPLPGDLKVETGDDGRLQKPPFSAENLAAAARVEWDPVTAHNEVSDRESV